MSRLLTTFLNLGLLALAVWSADLLDSAHSIHNYGLRVAAMSGILIGLFGVFKLVHPSPRVGWVRIAFGTAGLVGLFAISEADPGKSLRWVVPLAVALIGLVLWHDHRHRVVNTVQLSQMIGIIVAGCLLFIFQSLIPSKAIIVLMVVVAVVVAITSYVFPHDGHRSS
jgi:hypothetical protein